MAAKSRLGGGSATFAELTVKPTKRMQFPRKEEGGGQMAVRPVHLPNQHQSQDTEPRT